MKPSSSDHTKVHVIQDCEFFFHFDWKALRNRAVSPPFVPEDGSVFETKKESIEGSIETATAAARAVSPVGGADAVDDYRYDDAEDQAEMKQKLEEMEHSSDKKHIAGCIATRERLIDRGAKFFSRSNTTVSGTKPAENRAKNNVRRGGVLRASSKWKLTLAAVQALKNKGDQDDAETDGLSTSRSAYSDAGVYFRSPSKSFLGHRQSIHGKGADEFSSALAALRSSGIVRRESTSSGLSASYHGRPATSHGASASQMILQSASSHGPFTPSHRLSVSVSSASRKDSVLDVTNHGRDRTGSIMSTTSQGPSLRAELAAVASKMDTTIGLSKRGSVLVSPCADRQQASARAPSLDASNHSEKTKTNALDSSNHSIPRVESFSDTSNHGRVSSSRKGSTLQSPIHKTLNAGENNSSFKKCDSTETDGGGMVSGTMATITSIEEESLEEGVQGAGVGGTRFQGLPSISTPSSIKGQSGAPARKLLRPKSESFIVATVAQTKEEAATFSSPKTPSESSAVPQLLAIKTASEKGGRISRSNSRNDLSSLGALTQRSSVTVYEAPSNRPATSAASGKANRRPSSVAQEQKSDYSRKMSVTNRKLSTATETSSALTARSTKSDMPVGEINEKLSLSRSRSVSALRHSRASDATLTTANLSTLQSPSKKPVFASLTAAALAESSKSAPSFVHPLKSFIGTQNIDTSYTRRRAPSVYSAVSACDQQSVIDSDDEERDGFRPMRKASSTVDLFKASNIAASRVRATSGASGSRRSILFSGDNDGEKTKQSSRTPAPFAGRPISSSLVGGRETRSFHGRYIGSQAIFIKFGGFTSTFPKSMAK